MAVFFNLIINCLWLFLLHLRNYKTQYLNNRLYDRDDYLDIVFL